MSKRTFSLEECKIQASILLKNLQSPDSKASQMAMSRFHEFSLIKDLELLTANEYQLKHCLQVIAFEYGFDSYNGLKFYFTDTINTQLPSGGGFLHKWFNNYKEAKANFSAINEFLFPHKNHFFIASSGYIDYIAIDINNPDWANIRNNWVEPKDLEAWRRLNWQLNKKVGVQNG
ncbi:MAG: hypothetical protein ACK5Z5_00130 [Neisseriaceae bacterium]